MSEDTEEMPVVYAVLLAAGQSRRFDDGNKLLADIGSKTMVRHVAEGLVASRADGIVVVTGFEKRKIAKALKGLDLKLVENEHYLYGLASSIRTGIAALPDEADGAMICLADMPSLTAAVVDTLVQVFKTLGAEKIVYPCRTDGTQGNPVIWPRKYYDKLMSLTGDAGAKEVLEKNIEHAEGLKVTASKVLDDIDTPDDLAAWNRSSCKKKS